MDMADVTLSATPKGNGFQATMTYSSGVSGSVRQKSYPTKAEAISAAAMKVLDMPDRLEANSMRRTPRTFDAARHMFTRTRYLRVSDNTGPEQKERRKP
jgi:hypothetical protein